MKLREFESKIKNYPLFNLNDIRKIDPGFHRQQLIYWRNQRYIKPLAGGYYMLAEMQVNEPILFMLANKIYEPSYVSLESALAYYQVIPESVFGVTSISSRKTTQFESDFGIIQYRSIKPDYLFGYQIIETSPRIKYKIARLEKAILDYLYLHSEIESTDDFELLRWNIESVTMILENKNFLSYLHQFGKLALNRRVRFLLEYIHA
jgi:predicted transcriptional regulator of viral defense system